MTKLEELKSVYDAAWAATRDAYAAYDASYDAYAACDAAADAARDANAAYDAANEDYQAELNKENTND